ncbi:GGDEF domain-containing protein [Luteimonas cucumeris]|uniref:GGDEF domain-containing protein n=1 Tax=Luteimonas cucumeris TaxID=985012 RepID=UPI0013155F48|nr:GGDEF domain-containing protein [Luteimonas cucumeris]
MIAGSAIGVMALLAIVLSLLAMEHRSATHLARRSAGNLVQLIDADITRSIGLYDLALQGAATAAATPGIDKLPPQLRRELYFGRAVAAPHSERMLILDADGRVIANSGRGDHLPASFRGRPCFDVHARDPAHGLCISSPYRLGAGADAWHIAFSRRVASADGRFAGVALGEMKLRYFSVLFRSLEFGASTHVSLLQQDGALLARHPSTGRDMTGTDFSASPNFQRMVREREGSFTALSAVNGEVRLFTFSRVGELPLVLLIAISADEVYASWRRTAALVGGATLLLCLTGVGFAWLLRHELRLRHETGERMAALAATDPLTGLANRRQLDERLDAEWQRSFHNKRPLSLLMIDVDRFKWVNDVHGHARGDDILCTIANLIRQHLQRPADAGARYGGDEFCVLLPETDESGAAAVAEAIRADVQRILSHGGEADVTVSIGYASRIATQHEDVLSMIAIADAALYEAKHRGRNKVVGERCSETDLEA